jgi:acetylornithine deacetylase
MESRQLEARACATIDAGAIAADVGALVRVPSITGSERAAAELVADMAAGLGLKAEVHEHDLAALRSHPDYPGEEAERDELVGAVVTLPAVGTGAPRVCLNGHIDVVGPGRRPWTFDPFAGEVAEAHVRGRGSVDMKGGVIAALHAMAAAHAAGGEERGEVVLQAVPAEEDGGLGTFAALERDDRFDACVIPEPTGFRLCCAQAGAATFEVVLHGVSAHAAVRREGVSALDRYVELHQALAEHERRLNSDVHHPLMSELELPYPLLVGRLETGTWSSQVPDRLWFQGRLGVALDQSVADARRAFEAVVRAVCPDAEISWPGGLFAPGETPIDHPLVSLVRGAAEDELGRPVELCGVPYGADMRLFTQRGVPTVMIGTGSLALAHAVDEQVRVDELTTLARLLTRTILRATLATDSCV